MSRYCKHEYVVLDRLARTIEGYRIPEFHCEAPPHKLVRDCGEVLLGWEVAMDRSYAGRVEGEHMPTGQPKMYYRLDREVLEE